HSPCARGFAALWLAEARGDGPRVGHAASRADARRARGRHEPRRNRRHGALHSRRECGVGRDGADGRARHGSGHGPFQPCGRAEFWSGDRAGRARRSAGQPGSDPGLPGLGRGLRTARTPAKRARAGGSCGCSTGGRLMDWLFLFEVVLAGIGGGGLYALAGLAFVIIYKATRVVNLAIGEMLMLGAYAFFAFAAGLQWPVPVAILAAIVVSGVLGGVVERLAIRPMLGESPISVFMVAVGLGSIMVGVVELIWSADQRRLPEFIPNDPIFIGEAFISSKIFYSFIVAVLLVAVSLAVFRWWRGGVALRATATDQAAAYAMGINVPR